ncbi:PMT family glycosyltransferase, 4-amino-4-deoxy-L-arabinose transferase [Salinisphaera dokdonensis CL-ES53]|uniref:PMT family glycosyltransferase, 4-amino-4-deoxy-L-arabinose transferase n=1 Tax=Salinisphaera dokdonensis CL-ES53 TaxID=1304272 RepID=A0ABV2B3I1_9GAMM
MAVAVIALLALAVAGRGMSDIPLESHEIYVAQTAENMLESGDWLVPRLNGEYRLTKPPLSYWLVAGAATLAGQDHVGAGIARAPSVFAVIGVALLALWIGTRLFDPRIGLLAGLLCVASLAAFKYGHNARPDMLYAFWTTAVLAAWVGTRQAGAALQARWAWALWLLVGLATLTKGPQAPLILLLGLGLHAVLSGERAVDLWRRLRPVRGLLIVLALVVPWYLLLRQAIGGQTLGDSQLSGALLTIDPLRLFTPFYLLRAPMLWLPWALLLPAAALIAWRDRRGAAGLLAFTIVFAMLAFALGPQYREIYMLPWLAPAMLLLAAAITRVAWARVCVGLVIAVVGVALVWLVYEAGLSALLVAAAGLLLVGGAGWALRRRRTPAAAALVAGAFAVGLFQGGAMPTLWSSARYDELIFVKVLSRHVEPEMPIVVWDIDAAHYSYYLDRPVKGAEALDAVCDWISRQNAAVLLIYPRERRRELAGWLAFEPLLADNNSEFSATRLPPGTACRAPQNAGA